MAKTLLVLETADKTGKLLFQMPAKGRAVNGAETVRESSLVKRALTKHKNRRCKSQKRFQGLKYDLECLSDPS